MPAPSSRGPSSGEHRFRVVVYAIEEGNERVVMEGTGTGHHAAVGYFDGKKVVGKHSVGGPPAVLNALAQLIADYPTG
jgi:hypothetical protein